MALGAINGLQGEQSAAVCRVTLNHDLYPPVCKGVWLSGSLLIIKYRVLWI